MATQFYCDVCGELIDDVGVAMLIARSDSESPIRASGFKIVHKSIEGRTCDPDDDDYSLSVELSGLLDEDGTTTLLSWLSSGPLSNAGSAPAPLDEFTDTARRFLVPGYEEARRSFDQPAVLEEYSSANGVFPYTARQLSRIASMFDE